MDFARTTSPALNLVGLSIRTSHTDAPQDIPAFWGKIMAEGALFSVPSTRPGTIYAVYKDMEDKWHGAYTMMLAVEVEPGSPVPQSFVTLDVPASERDCATLTDASPQGVMKAWNYVWNDWPKREQRSYGMDLEVHQHAPDGTAKVELRLSMQG